MVKKVGRPADINEETINEIVRMYDETPLGARRIAKALGVSVDKVIYYLRKNGRMKLASPKGSYTER